MKSGQLHERLREMHAKYGLIVRIAPNELSYADKRAWRDIYEKRPGNQLFLRNETWFRKDEWGGDKNEPHSIFSHAETHHSRFRRAFQPAFSDGSLQKQAQMIEGYADLFIQQMRSFSNKTVDMTQWFNFFTFDVAGDLSFGESFKCLEEKQAHPWVQIAQDFGKGVALIASLNFYWPLNVLLQYFIPKEFVERNKLHRQMSAQRAQKRLNNCDSERPDFVTPALVKSNRDSKASIADNEWGINLAVIVFAASETTSSALTVIFRELLKFENGEFLKRVTQEIRTTYSSETEISISSISKSKRLEQLESVIQEGLRLGPPVAIGVPRVVPRGGAMVCNRWVPGGVCHSSLLSSRVD